jgi:hypothetical protein
MMGLGFFGCCGSLCVSNGFLILSQQPNRAAMKTHFKFYEFVLA